MRMEKLIERKKERKKKQPKVNWNESIFCVFGCVCIKRIYISFERFLSVDFLGAAIAPYYVLCVISYCILRFFFRFFLFFSFSPYDITIFRWIHLISRADVARTTIANNRNHPKKLLSVVGRKSANKSNKEQIDTTDKNNNSTVKSSSWVRAYCIELKTI